MTDLPVHLTTHHLQLSNALRRFVRKKITAVKRFANDAISAEVVLRRHGGAKTRFSASARLALPGRDVHGRAVEANLYAAIAHLVTRLGRLLRKRKTRLGRALARAASDPVRGPIVPAIEDEATPRPDVARQSRHRQPGQEMRVFPLRRRDRIRSIVSEHNLHPDLSSWAGGLHTAWALRENRKEYVK
jgi:putative sigma-54 modulation protein